MRMTGGTSFAAGGGSSSGGGGGGIAGGATQAWVDENYIGKAWLAQMMLSYNGTTLVEPNDVDTGIDLLSVVVAASFAEAVTMASTLSVTGDTTLGGTLGVTGDTTLGGTLGVTGDTTLGGTLGVTGNTTLGGNLTVTGSLTVGNEAVATQTWVGQNYVSIAFFSRLFQAYNGSGSGASAVNPNDTTSTITSIKAMFGFWTDFYISALGNGGSASSAIYLSQLGDVNVAGVQNGQVLTYNSSQAKWVAGSPGGGGTVTSIKVGTTSYTPVSGVVSLPSYPTVPTNVSAFTNDAGYLTSSALSGLTKVYTYSIPGTKGVRITYGAKVPVIISANRSTGQAQLMLAGSGYGVGGTGRNTFSEIVPCGSSRFTWSLPQSDSISCSVEIMNVPTNDASVVVLSTAAVTFTEITALTSPAQNGTTVLYPSNVGNYALPLTGGTLSGTGADIFSIDRNSTSPAWVRFLKNGTLSGQIGVSPDHTLVFDDGTSSYNIYHSGNFTPGNYLPLAGGTMTGHIALDGQAVYFGKTGSRAILSYGGSYPNHGIWYHDESVDKMAFSASGNANVVANADLCLNGGGDGVVTIRGNAIIHAGTIASQSVASAAACTGNAATATKLAASKTIWGQSFDGSGNVTGDLTVGDGSIYLNNNKAIKARNAANNAWYTIFNLGSSNDCVFGYGSAGAGGATYIDGNNIFFRYGTSHTDAMKITNSGYVGIGTSSPDAKLHVANEAHFAKGAKFQNVCIEVDNSMGNTSRSSEINNYSAPLYLQHNSDKNLLMCNGGGNVAIGNTSASYKLHVTGDIYATGGVTCLSDARKKDVVCDLPITVDEVANAPAIRFLWKDERKVGYQAGTLAQYWQKVLPEVITDKSGELSMQYGVTALVAAIVTARRVTDHEERIRQLEAENRRLRNEVEQLKAA